MAKGSLTPSTITTFGIDDEEVEKHKAARLLVNRIRLLDLMNMFQRKVQGKNGRITFRLLMRI